MVLFSMVLLLVKNCRVSQSDVVGFGFEYLCLIGPDHPDDNVFVAEIAFLISAKRDICDILGSG